MYLLQRSRTDKGVKERKRTLDAIQAAQVLTLGDEFFGGFPKGSPVQMQPAGFKRTVR